MKCQGVRTTDKEEWKKEVRANLQNKFAALMVPGENRRSCIGAVEEIIDESFAVSDMLSTN